jgi:raffinose/stachyose/melibiose transport system permease protein
MTDSIRKDPAPGRVPRPAPPGGGTPSPGGRRPRGLGWGVRAEIAVLTGPALVMFLGFVIFPVVMAAYYGFYSWQGYGAPHNFVGLRNYVTILQDSTFIDALQHNGTIVVLSLVV